MNYIRFIVRTTRQFNFTLPTSLCFATLLLCTISTGFAATQNTDFTDNNPNAVVVTATRFPTTIPSAPTNVTVISSEEIAHSSASTLSQALQILGGVHVNDLFGISGSKSSIDLGGFGATGALNSLVLVNGRRLNDVDLSGANLAAIPLQSIDRIEIIHGNASVLYGDNASSGVINIVTKSGFNHSASSVNLSEGFYDTTRLRTSIVNEKERDAAAFFLDYFDSTGYRHNSGFRNANAQLEVSRQLDNGQLGVRFNNSDEHTELPGDLNEPVYLTDPRASSLSNEFADEQRHLIETYYQNEHVAGELSYREKHQTSTQFGSTDAWLRTLAFTPRITIHNTKNQLIGGIDYYRSRLSALADFGTPNINTSYTTRNSAALYLSNRYTVTTRSNISLGIRREIVSLEIKNLNVSSAGGNAERRSDGEYAWDVNFSHRFTPKARVYTRLARGFRFPVLDEMWDYYYGSISLLNPQTSTQLELGGELQLKRDTQLQADLFYSKLHNEIAFNAVTYSNINLDPTRHEGLNLQLTHQLGRGNQIRANYSYRNALFSEGPYAGKHIPLVASHNFTLSQQYTSPAGDIFSIDTVYTGRRYFGDDNSNVGKQLPDYTRINLGYQLKLSHGFLKTTINNLTDIKTADIGYYRSYLANPYNYYPLPERSLYMELGFTL